MFFSLWSVKGGSGATVVAATLALVLARRRSDEVLLVDLAGDLPAALALPEPPDAGLTDWLDAGSDVPADALARLEVPVVDGLRLLPRGEGPMRGSERGGVLCRILADDPRDVVVDCGTLSSTHPDEVPLLVAMSATQSLLVTRPCYLGLRRALAAPLRPSQLIVVSEPERALDSADIEEILGVPVLAELQWDPAVARAIDAGLFVARVPRALERAMRRAA